MNWPILLASDGTSKSMPVGMAPCNATPPFWGRPGWARFARKVLLTQTDEANAHETGPLLSAEWIDGDGRSCRIASHPSKPGQRQVITFPAASEGWECDRVAVLGRGDLTGRTLLYDIYWTDDGEGAVRPAFDVFRGFGNVERSGT